MDKKIKAYTAVVFLDSRNDVTKLAKQFAGAGLDVFVVKGVGYNTGRDNQVLDFYDMETKYKMYITNYTDTSNPEEAFEKIYRRILQDDGLKLSVSGEYIFFEGKYGYACFESAPNNLDFWAKIKKQGRSGSAKCIYLDSEVNKYLNDLSAKYKIKTSQVINGIIKEYITEHL